MWFKNARFYTVDFRALTPLLRDERLIENALARCAFRPLGAAASAGAGFAPWLKDGGARHFSSGSAHFFRIIGEKRLLPAAVVRHELEEAAEREELNLKRALRREEREALRTAVTGRLTARAFPLRRELALWCDTALGLCALSTASPSRADEALALAREAFDSFPARPLEPGAPAEALLTEWLKNSRAAGSFSLGGSATLRDPDQAGGVIRITREDLSAGEITALLKDGRRVSELELGFTDRLTLVLRSDLSVRRLRAEDRYLARGLPEAADAQAQLILEGSLLGSLGTGLKETFAAARRP